MARLNYLEQIRHRVNAAEVSSVFIPSDFFDISEAAKINTCLNRLVKSGDLNRPMRGVFAKPRYSQMLHTDIPPSSSEIANAIARNYGWTIIPCGDTALNTCSAFFHKNSYRHVFACSVCIPVIVVIAATALCILFGV